MRSTVCFELHILIHIVCMNVPGLLGVDEVIPCREAFVKTGCQIVNTKAGIGPRGVDKNIQPPSSELRFPIDYRAVLSNETVQAARVPEHARTFLMTCYFAMQL